MHLAVAPAKIAATATPAIAISAAIALPIPIATTAVALAIAVAAAASATALLARLPAGRTARWLIGKALLRIELLLTRREDELRATIPAR